MPQNPTNEIFALTLPATGASLPLATALVEPLITRLNFGDRDAFRVGVTIEEACVNVIEHAYAPGEAGDFTLRARIERSSLVISVEDRGLPRDPFARSAFDLDNPVAPGLGTRILEGMADEVRYLALGRGGKAIEMFIRLPAVPADEAPQIEPGAPLVRIPPESLRIRDFRAEDAGQVAQCSYRCYDYSYVGDALYVPERVIEMNLTGEMVARERGVPGVWSEAVTNHPASQRANLELGVRETGLLFGMLPTSQRMRNLPGLLRRGTLLLFYIPFEQNPLSRVCLPARHAGVLRDIYDRLGFAIHEIAPATPSAGSTSEVIVQVRVDVGISTMRVEAIGEDLVDVLRREITRACDAGTRVVLIDLPMHDGGLPGAVSALEGHGCHFAGIIPRRYPTGDSLRMTYLDHVQIDLGALSLASEFGQRLRDYLAQGLSPELIVRETGRAPGS
jgi:anti-sigma regulatory factor (Ser/Thr protein kinase)